MNARGTRVGNCSASEKREVVSRHERPARRVSIGQRRFAFHRHCRGSERLDVALQSICHTRGESQSPDLPPAARADWPGIESRLTLVEDTYVIDQPVVFDATKDRPVLLTAYKHSDVLLTLDRRDFLRTIGSRFYHLEILTPEQFIRRQRQHGLIKVP